MHLPLGMLLAFTACWATASDLRSRRIPNWLTFGAAGAALGVRLAFGGGEALIGGAEAWLLGTGIFFVPFALGWMGAGDVKLLAAFGALGGPAFLIQAAFAGCLAGGVIALAYLVCQRRLMFFMWHVLVHIRHPFSGVLEGRRRIPYGPALSLGALGIMLAGAAGSFV
jgi:prepilin peptidase CpaA